MATDFARPRPLDGQEIKLGVAYLISDLIEEALIDRFGTSCALYGRAYPKFRATISIHLELDNYGDVTEDNHSLVIQEGGEMENPVLIDKKLEIPEMPPNQFRIDTEQPIMVATVEDGRAVEKEVKYKLRPTSRRARQNGN